jgi:surfactin synthase thioesterase subunit
VVRRYRPPCYTGPIAIVASEKVYQKDPTLGWNGLTQSDLPTGVVPGDHDSYLREHVQVAAKRLRDHLEQAAKRVLDERASAETVQTHE